MGRSMFSSVSLFRWAELDFSNLARSLSGGLSGSISRWRSEFGFSFTRLAPANWNLSSLYWPLNLSIAIVDSILWTLITAVESVALVAMLCCFFLCCGCTL